ncbi:glutamate racemase [Facklamia sp. DSM 111018]|uniref:Glutamate racemase n=1 Tax=Facklamia lactis TaxID=2749967 RepID=A0ABS0LP98_9LACT|nr:glutamate racemase [Facklamia lactis]MBG9985964.1 glutamate racemase [Facklamia lactis]
MKELPIGFIDSGYGGLTVVKQSLKQLPNESIIYLGDNARCPYGPRSLMEVRKFIWQLTHFLREKGIKMLVIACNTGTAAALDELKAVLPIPVVGVIASGSRAAIKQTQNNQIGVIGTAGTINSQLYTRTILEKTAKVKVESLACPSFVELVEEDRLDESSTQPHVNEVLKPIIQSGIDTLVLGCTHYPLMKREIKEASGSKVHLIDSGVETINEVSMLLDYFNLSRTAEEQEQDPASQIYYTTGEIEPFKVIAGKWLKADDIVVRQCRIKGEIIVEATNCES